MTDSREHLERLFDRQNGKCAICGGLAELDGKPNAPLSAVRFRIGSSESWCISDAQTRAPAKTN